MTFSDLSPENTITDDDGNVIGIKDSPVHTTAEWGALAEAFSSQLDEILKQLRYINIHLSHLSDQELDEGDFE